MSKKGHEQRFRRARIRCKERSDLVPGPAGTEDPVPCQISFPAYAESHGLRSADPAFQKNIPSLGKNLRSQALISAKEISDKGTTSGSFTGSPLPTPSYVGFACALPFYFMACSTATATATEAPTMGLFPIPMKPIISTCAGTDEDPANCASECILPMVSVIP